MGSDVAIMLLRTLFLYFVIMVTLRIMGKREIGKLSLFDFVVAIMIAEVAVFSIEDPNLPLIKGILPIFVLMLTQMVFSYLSLKSKKLRDLIDGRSAILIENGKIKDKEMARNRYNMDDLLIQLREKNIANLADVEFAILEPSGKLSVIKKPDKQPVTREDLGIKPPANGIPTPVIIDGRVIEENLQKVGKSKLWLKQQLKKFGTTDFHKVIFCSVDQHGNMFVDLKDF